MDRYNLELFLLKFMFCPQMISSKHHYLEPKLVSTTTSLHKSLIFQPYLLDHQRKLELVVGRNFMNIKMKGNKEKKLFLILYLNFCTQESHLIIRKIQKKYLDIP